MTAESSSLGTSAAAAFEAEADNEPPESLKTSFCLPGTFSREPSAPMLGTNSTS